MEPAESELQIGDDVVSSEKEIFGKIIEFREDPETKAKCAVVKHEEHTEVVPLSELHKIYDEREAFQET